MPNYFNRWIELPLWLMEDPDFIKNNADALFEEMQTTIKLPQEVIDDLCTFGVPKISGYLIDKYGNDLTQTQLKNLCLRNHDHFNKYILCKSTAPFVNPEPSSDQDKARHWNIYIRSEVAKSTSDMQIMEQLAQDTSEWVVAGLVANPALTQDLLHSIVSNTIAANSEENICILLSVVEYKLNALTKEMQSNICFNYDEEIRAECAKYIEDRSLLQAMVDMEEEAVINAASGNKIFDKHFIAANLRSRNCILLYAMASSSNLTKRQAAKLAKNEDELVIERLVLKNWSLFSLSSLFKLLARVRERSTISAIVCAMQNKKEWSLHD